ncbi:MAG TPA: competence/damage-inducible protein A [Firmicutes bacterium]|nr:competence/damage-inducible protein A [Bacillota bacterium]
MRAEIICVGTELLLGQIVNTNGAYLAEKLARLGIDLYHLSTVGDNLPRLTALLQQAWQRVDLVLISGGLGPTLDDLTREAVALLAGEELVEDPGARRMIEEYFYRRGLPMPPSNLRQALRPRSAVCLMNPYGTAPGLWLEKDGKMLAALPGVPIEMKNLMEKEVLPRVERARRARAETGDPGTVLVSRVLKAAGIGESAMTEEIQDLLAGQTNPTIAPLAKRGEVWLRLSAKARSEEAAFALIRPVEEEIRSRLAGYIFGTDGEQLEEVVGRILTARGLTLGTAESCTGGLLSHRITGVPGASAYFLAGVVAYANRIKEKALGVEKTLLQEYGAVSPQVARAMAEGMRKYYGVDLALSTTGIAGPGGGTAKKPVGLVYLALAHPEGTVTREERFCWDRTENKIATAQAGLVMLWQYLEGAFSCAQQGNC